MVVEISIISRFFYIRNRWLALGFVKHQQQGLESLNHDNDFSFVSPATLSILFFISLDIIASDQIGLRFLLKITIINRKWVLDGLAIRLATFRCPSNCKLLFNVHTGRPPQMKPKVSMHLSKIGALFNNAPKYPQCH